MKNAAFILFCFLFLSAYSIGQELYPYRDSGGKYGYKEKSGKIIIPANYDRAWNFSKVWRSWKSMEREVLSIRPARWRYLRVSMLPVLFLRV